MHRSSAAFEAIGITFANFFGTLLITLLLYHGWIQLTGSAPSAVSSWLSALLISCFLYLVSLGKVWAKGEKLTKTPLSTHISILIIINALTLANVLSFAYLWIHNAAEAAFMIQLIPSFLLAGFGVSLVLILKWSRAQVGPSLYVSVAANVLSFGSCFIKTLIIAAQ